MAVRYHVKLEPKNGGVSVTRKFDSTIETSSIPMNEIAEIQRMCSHFNWSQSGVSQKIGEALYTIVNGESELLESATVKADARGEPLQLFIEGPAPDLPFELLYKSHFLVPSKIHVIHCVSDYGCEKEVNPENRPLRVLFMACSPQDAEPVLDYEKEEDTILDVTKKFPVDIDVEDTGSLQGLKDRLSHYYDVVYISGHADIDEGTPIFLMENETGYRVPVTPEDLWDALKLNPPRLLFLSGCRTGQVPEHEAAVSFAHELVLKHSSTVLGWGLPVSDPGARKAAKNLFYELSRGKSILDAVFSARRELYDKKWPDWSLLRLFSDGTPLDIPLVEEGQKLEVKARDIQYAYLQNSQVKVLKKGFVGRRRQIQRGIKSLKEDEVKSGLLLHGTGGLGKSCLAGKFCDRFKDHALIIVHGKLTAAKFLEAVKDAFIRTGDDNGLEIVQQRLEIPDKIRVLCSISFQKEKYLIVLDDFEKNLKGYEQGIPALSDEVFPILQKLLQYLPLAVKKTQLIITSRYTFPLTTNGRDLVEERLESIGLTSFRGADERKKVAELQYINQYDDPDIRRKLIEAGRRNPRLMEALNSLIMAEKVVDKALLKKVKGKQEEFVQELILKEILESQPQNFQRVMQYASVYGLPVSRKGLEKVCGKIENWRSFIDSGVQLSLIEKGRNRMVYYWVTPLLREGIFKNLSEDEQKLCHKGAVKYYQEVVAADGYEPMYAFEFIEHALLCGMDEAAVKEGGRLLSYLRNVLLYREALSEGGHILSSISEMKENEESALFLNRLGMILLDVGDFRKAIPCFEKALEIDRKVYGEEHPSVATDLNNLGGAWRSLGDYKKAVQYFEKALEIDRKVYGEEHPDVATVLNNLGGAWKSLGDSKKSCTVLRESI